MGKENIQSEFVETFPYPHPKSYCPKLLTDWLLAHFHTPVFLLFSIRVLVIRICFLNTQLQLTRRAGSNILGKTPFGSPVTGDVQRLNRGPLKPVPKKSRT